MPKDHDLTNIFHKTALSMNFLKWIFSSARQILLPNVLCFLNKNIWLIINQINVRGYKKLKLLKTMLKMLFFISLDQHTKCIKLEI